MDPRTRSRTPWNERPVLVPQEVLDLADECLADVVAFSRLLPTPAGISSRQLVGQVRMLVETQHIGAMGPPELSDAEILALNRVAALALLAIRASKR